MLDLLSATGLRAIRFSKELEHVKLVTANDYAPSAFKLINDNLKLNGLTNDKVTGKIFIILLFFFCIFCFAFCF